MNLIQFVKSLLFCRKGHRYGFPIGYTGTRYCSKCGKTGPSDYGYARHAISFDVSGCATSDKYGIFKKL